jgi:hypothetical protein
VVCATKGKRPLKQDAAPTSTGMCGGRELKEKFTLPWCNSQCDVDPIRNTAIPVLDEDAVVVRIMMRLCRKKEQDIRERK